ncbi:MAG: hypothetical protein RL431_225 [Actinomycetota bacterium]|jgi:hypothetical protein
MNLMRTSFVKIVAAALAGVGFVVAVTSAGAQCCMVDVWSDFVTWPNRMTGQGRADFYLLVLGVIVLAAVAGGLWIRRRNAVVFLGIGVALAGLYYGQELIHALAVSMGASDTIWNLIQHEWMTWRIIPAGAGAAIAAAALFTMVAAAFSSRAEVAKRIESA